MIRVPDSKALSIGRVAQLAGVPLTTVRFYERAKIVQPVGRTGANYRVYSPDAVARIRFTRRAQELGFTLREVKDLLALQSNGKHTCEKVRANATAKINDINSRIRSLRRIGRALAKLSLECEMHAGDTGCPLLDYLDEKL
jgi:MerR family mercuric resistance operon transcriptional regulator